MSAFMTQTFDDLELDIEMYGATPYLYDTLVANGRHKDAQELVRRHPGVEPRQVAVARVSKAVDVLTGGQK